MLWNGVLYKKSIFTLQTLLVFASVGFSQTSYKGLPFINNYSTDDYKGGIQNWQITQDNRGIMYIANNFGVLEFDGSTWNQYPIIKGTKIRSIAIAQDGRIYIGSQGDFGYFFPNNKGQFIYKSLIDILPANQRNIDEVWRVYLEGEKVLFCTFSNIYIYEENKLSVVRSNLYLEPSYYHNHRLYIQSPGHPLMTLDNNNKITEIDNSDFYRDKLITGVLPHNKTDILIVTKNHGAFLFDGYSSKKWSEESIWNDLTINCSMKMQDGNVVIGTQSKGLFVLNSEGEVLLKLDISNGLASNTILSLFQDASNNLWAGLNNGISHIELAAPFTIIDHNIGVEGTGYAAYVYENVLYLGTNIGLFRSEHQNNNHFQFKFEKVQNSDGQVYNIQEFYNTLFIDHHNGTYIAEENVLRHISTTGSWLLIKNPVVENSLILGTYSGISFLKRNNNLWNDSGRMFGFYESSRVMEVDDANKLWMTHGYKGAFKLTIDYEKDSILDVKFYNSNHGFPSDILINVYKINNELLFTAERGIYHYDADRDIFVHHPKYTKVLGTNIHIRDMDEDPLGNIYFITSDQCGVIKQRGENEIIVDYNTFNKIPSLLNDDLVNVNAIDLNNVIFSGKEGFIHYEVNKSSSIEREFSTLIRRVETITKNDSLLYAGNFVSNGQRSNTQPESVDIRLPYNFNDVRFTFASPFYEGNSSIQYKFMLQNFDENWSEWNSKTEKEYTNLPEGDYVFQVRSKNIFNEESKTTTFKITIDAPWYRSVYAYLAYAIGAFIFIFSGIFFVDKKHKKDKDALQKQQQKELVRKDEQLQTIQTEKETEIASLREEKLNAELNHKNTELTSATMNLLTKNELIIDIRTKLNSIQETAIKTETKKNIGKILKEIEASTDLDKDWEQLEFHFDRVHRDFNKRIKKEFADLTPTEMKLCIYLRLNFTTKEIAQLLHISVRGVEISRYRLRKKLKLTRDQNLSDFILSY